VSEVDDIVMTGMDGDIYNMIR